MASELQNSENPYAWIYFIPFILAFTGEADIMNRGKDYSGSSDRWWGIGNIRGQLSGHYSLKHTRQA